MFIQIFKKNKDDTYYLKIYAIHNICINYFIFKIEDIRRLYNKFGDLPMQGLQGRLWGLGKYIKCISIDV